MVKINYILSVLLLLFSPLSAFAAIAYDNAVVNLAVTSSSNNTSLTVASSADRFLTACIFSNTGDNLTGITATKGGVDTAMTQIIKFNGGASGGEEIYCYGILNEDSGTVNVKASFSATPISRMTVSSYNGVSQSMNLSTLTTTSNSGTSNSFTGTLTNPSSNDWDILWTRANGTLTASTGSTERPSPQNTSSSLFDTNGAVSGSNSMSVSLDASASFAYAMYAIEPVISPTVSIPILGLVHAYWIN